MFQIDILCKCYCIVFYIANDFMEPHLPGRKRLRSKEGDDVYSPGMFHKITFIFSLPIHFLF